MYFLKRFRNLYFIGENFIQHFLPFLSLCGFSCLISEAADKIFKFIDFFLLLFVTRHQSFKLYTADFFIMSIISGIAVKVSVKKLVDFVYRNIKKIAVMRNEEESAFKIMQEAFKPVTGFYIKIVCRLVKKKNIRFLKKNLGKRNTHLPAAGKFLYGTGHVFCFKAESFQYLAGKHIAAVPAGIFQKSDNFLLPLKKRVGCTIRKLRSKLITDFIHFLMKFVAERKSPVSFFKQSAALMNDTRLRQITDAAAFLNGS